MPVLAQQHQPGAWKDHTDPYMVVCAWPDDCMVQWGSHGAVLCKNKPSYTTAFFEAFPRDPDTFIREEGSTIAEAEEDAFKQFTRFAGCEHLEYEKRRYKNGCGFCIACGMFKTNVFEPDEHCSICGKATYYTYGKDSDEVYHWYCEEHSHLRPRDTQPSPVDQLEADIAEAERQVLESGNV